MDWLEEHSREHTVLICLFLGFFFSAKKIDIKKINCAGTAFFHEFS